MVLHNYSVEINPLEHAMLTSALEQYISYCDSCLSVPENKQQEIFIRTDRDLAKKLLARLPK